MGGLIEENRRLRNQIEGRDDTPKVHYNWFDDDDDEEDEEED